jgi:type II secretory pathway pseudopilin PulG
MNSRTKAFSLVEVVVALAITVFAGFALIGLLAVGLQTAQDSKQRLQAATVAESLCSTRRASPTNDLTTLQPNFPLPGLASNANNFASPTFLTWDGAATSTASNARFGFIYSFNTNASPGSSTVHLWLYWPAMAPPTNPATGYYEVSTAVALP